MYRSSMFAFGGWNGHDTLDDLYEFSMIPAQWHSVPGRGDVPPSRYRHSAVVYGCCMFVFGGVDKRQARFADLCEFSFDTRSWSRVKTFGDPPSARTFHRSPNKFVIPGLAMIKTRKKPATKAKKMLM